MSDYVEENPVFRLGALINLYQKKGVNEPSYYCSYKNYEIEIYYSAINDCVVLSFVTFINGLDTNVIIYNPIVSDSLYDAKIISQNSNRNTGGILINKKILSTLV